MAETSTTSHIDYEALFQSFGTAYIVFDIDDPSFTVIAENQAHADIAMVNKENVIGKPVLESFPDTSEDYITKGESRLLESIRKVIATGKPDMMPVLKYDLKDENGVLTDKVWEVSHHPIFEGRTVKAVFQQTKDITETIAARQELTVAQDQLDQALTYSEVGTWIWNIEDDIVIADKNLAKLFGIGDGTCQVEVPIGVFLGSIHNEDVERVKQTIAGALAQKLSGYESEYRTFDFDGNIRWLLARGHIEFDEQGEPKKFPGIVVDITRRKLTENNLHILAKANTQFPASLGYRQTLESIASIIVPSIADWCSIDILEDGQIEEAAVAHSDPYRVKWAKELIAKRGPVDINATSGSSRVIKTGKTEHIHTMTDKSLQRLAQNDKELKVLRDLGICSSIIAPLKIDGETIGSISFISTESHRHYDESDVEIAEALANRTALAVYNANLFKDAKTEINERKKLQAELEKFNQVLEERVKKRTIQLEKTNEGLQEEIKLRHKIESQRLQHYMDLNKTKDEFISLASHQLRTPATGVKQYLGMVLEGMAGDITETQQTFLQKAYASNERQLTIVSDLLKVAQIDAGKIRIRQEDVDLVELITDVITEQKATHAMRRQKVEFIAPDGKACAFVDPDKMRMVFENMIDNASKYSDPGKSIRVSIREKNDMMVVEVKDNGVGVAPDDVEKLFEKFNRIHNHLSNHVGGTGLGLYWAKKVVDLHGGIIKVASVLNKGSTFSIYLPKNERPSLKTMKIGATYEG